MCHEQWALTVIKLLRFFCINNKYISGKTDDDVFYIHYIHIQTNNACTYYMRIVTGAVTDRQTDGQTVSYKGRGENDIQQ